MVGVQAFFVNFFMRSTKRYLNGKYSDFPSQSAYVRPRTTIYSTKQGDEHPRHFYTGVPSWDMLSVHQSILFGQNSIHKSILATL